MMVGAFRPGAGILIVGLISFVFFVFAIVDMARRPSYQWRQAGSNKALWVTLEIVTLLLLGLVSIIIGVLYFTTVRPRLVALERGGQPPGWQGGPEAPGQPYGTGFGTPGYGTPGYGTPGFGTPGYGATAPGYSPPGYAPPGLPGTGDALPDTSAGAPPPYPTQPAEPPPAAPFGWYPDPSTHHELRYWDGTRWTEHVSDQGVQSTDSVTG